MTSHRYHNLVYDRSACFGVRMQPSRRASGPALAVSLVGALVLTACEPAVEGSPQEVAGAPLVTATAVS